MHEDAAATREGIVDEVGGGGEVLEKVLVVYIVDLDEQVGVVGEQVPVQGHAQDGDDMSDVCVL